MRPFPFTKQDSKWSLKSTNFMSRRFPRPRKSTVFKRAQNDISKNLGSTENRMIKRMCSRKNDLKSAKLAVFRKIVMTVTVPCRTSNRKEHSTYMRYCTCLSHSLYVLLAKGVWKWHLAPSLKVSKVHVQNFRGLCPLYLIQWGC